MIDIVKHCLFHLCMNLTFYSKIFRFGLPLASWSINDCYVQLSHWVNHPV